MVNRKDKITKKILPNGEVRYYKNGKLLSNSIGRRLWVKQNQDADKSEFTPDELRNLKALQVHKKNWKFKGFSNVQYAIVDLLHAFGVIDKDNVPDKDLYNLFDSNGKRLFNDYKDIIDEVNRLTKKAKFEWSDASGLKDFRGRKETQSIVDIIELLDSENYKYYNFIVTDTNGKIHTGRINGIIVIQKFETMVTSIVKNNIDNSAFIRFKYQYKVDTKKRTIKLSIKDLKPKKSLEKLVKEAENTGPKQTLTIRNKYKDVIIEIFFS